MLCAQCGDTSTGSHVGFQGHTFCDLTCLMQWQSATGFYKFCPECGIGESYHSLPRYAQRCGR